MMPNNHTPLTAEEITTAKCLMSGCNSAPWHSAGTIVRNEDDQDICVIEERFQWNPGHGKRPTCDVVADAQAIAEARNNYPRAIATIEQQRKQIAALEKERDSLQAELQKWMERFGPAAEASCPR